MILPGLRATIARSALTLAVATLIGCGGQSLPSYSITTKGNPHQGKQVIESYGCGACHIIPGINGARGLVGPPLIMYGRRTIVAGEFPNTPDNLARWIQHPRTLEPNTAMPDMGLTLAQSYDAAAYLFTLH